MDVDAADCALPRGVALGRLQIVRRKHQVHRAPIPCATMMNVVCASHKPAVPGDSRWPPPTRKTVCAEEQKLCAPEQAAFRHVAYEEQKAVHTIGGKRSLASGPVKCCTAC